MISILTYHTDDAEFSNRNIYDLFAVLINANSKHDQIIKLLFDLIDKKLELLRANEISSIFLALNKLNFNWNEVHELALKLLRESLNEAPIDVTQIKDILNNAIKIGLTDTYLANNLHTCRSIIAHLGELNQLNNERINEMLHKLNFVRIQKLLVHLQMM